MNCDEIAEMLNAHQTDWSSAARRAAADAHLATCRDCASAWLVADALHRERWPNAPEGLLARIVEGLDPVDVARPQPAIRAARRTRQWAAPAALLAASVALAVGVAAWLGADRPQTPQSALQTNASGSEERADSPHAEGTVDPVSERTNVLEPGRHYRLVANAPAGAAGPRENGTFAGATPARVEVVQFFMYGCFPCYAFEPQVDGWETKADYVDLVRVPVVFNARAEVHARAFYAAEVLGVLDEMHDAFFVEIHERGARLDNEASLSEFFARFGVDEETFRRTYRSADVDKKVGSAIELARTLGVTATPSLVVARRYLTSPSITGSNEDTFAVVDALAKSVYEEGRGSEPCGGPQIAGGSASAEGEYRSRSRTASERPRTMDELLDFVSSGCAGPSDRILF